MGSIPIASTNDVSVRTFYRTDDMKINQKWLIFFYNLFNYKTKKLKKCKKDFIKEFTKKEIYL